MSVPGKGIHESGSIWKLKPAGYFRIFPDTWRTQFGIDKFPDLPDIAGMLPVTSGYTITGHEPVMGRRTEGDGIISLIDYYAVCYEGM